MTWFPNRDKAIYLVIPCSGTDLQGLARELREAEKRAGAQRVDIDGGVSTPGGPPVLDLRPPLLNSANPWATTLEDLRGLYSCTSTGAVTTRTSLIKGFPHDPSKHQFLFFGPADHEIARDRPAPGSRQNASINSLGYSPTPLEDYLGFIRIIASELPSGPPPTKYFIVSVTGTPDEVADSYRLIASAKADIPVPLAVEINLSCPNIPNLPPPAYSGTALAGYLAAVGDVIASRPDIPRLPFGIKTPPYTHAGEYQTLADVLAASAAAAGGSSPLSFITATNTLGSCLVPGGLPGAGIGGMAGAPLHPLALGNVATLRRMLDERAGALGHVRVLGVGGVLDAGGYRRMRAAGAAAVGIGTGLGLRGVEIFEEIEEGLGGEW